MYTNSLSKILGVPAVQGLDRDGLFTYRIHNPLLGVTLKLEVRPSSDWVRLHTDLDRRAGAKHLSSVELTGVRTVECDFERNEVHFLSKSVRLIVSPAGVFKLRPI